MSDKTILFVEDSPTMRRIIMNTLKRLGFSSIIEAENGVDALEKLSGKKIDLLMTDWNMPEMNGAELVEALRSRPGSSDLPILMITTRGVQEDIMTAMKLGVSGYVIKPFTPEILKDKLRAMGIL